MPVSEKTSRVISTAACMTTLSEQISGGKRVISVGKDEQICSQGEHAEAVYFVQTGKVKVSVVSSGGKEAVLAILGPKDFFGEESLVGQSRRTSTARALEPTTLVRVESRAMLRALQTRPDLSERFMALLLKRQIDLEEDLCDQLFNRTEKRLARVLMKLARFLERETVADTAIPRLSHETLAEMVGTTRSRVSYFLNKFRRMGLVQYNGHMIVKTKRLADVVLHPCPAVLHGQSHT